MKVIKTNIKAETVEINPREAEALRNTFQDNRRTYNDNIRKYAKQMKDGKWRLNGEPIIVDDQGCCVNGYHRLSACIEAGVPFRTLLVTGVPHETWTTVDTGKVRSAGDVFQIDGIKNGIAKATLVAKFSALVQGLNGIADTGSLHRLRSSSITREDLLKLYREHEEDFDKVISLIGKYSATLKGIITPSMLGGIIAYLYIQKGYKFSKLEGFVDRLATSGLSIYATGRVKLKSCRGFDKQKAICDIWNKFKTNKEKVRICITYVSGTFE